jgi:uncharacterized protein YqjF (DUF2071 family)
MGQSWRHLLFAHWTVDPDALRRVVPPQLPLDLHEGEAWTGVTPSRSRPERSSVTRHTPKPQCAGAREPELRRPPGGQGYRASQRPATWSLIAEREG